MTFIKCPFCLLKHAVHRDSGGTYINCLRREGMHHYLSKFYISLSVEQLNETDNATGDEKETEAKTDSKSFV